METEPSPAVVADTVQDAPKPKSRKKKKAAASVSAAPTTTTTNPAGAPTTHAVPLGDFIPMAELIASKLRSTAGKLPSSIFQILDKPTTARQRLSSAFAALQLYEPSQSSLAAPAITTPSAVNYVLAEDDATQTEETQVAFAALLQDLLALRAEFSAPQASLTGQRARSSTSAGISPTAQRQRWSTSKASRGQSGSRQRRKASSGGWSRTRPFSKRLFSQSGSDACLRTWTRTKTESVLMHRNAIFTGVWAITC
jgi:hypothetical protein